MLQVHHHFCGLASSPAELVHSCYTIQLLETCSLFETRGQPNHKDMFTLGALFQVVQGLDVSANTKQSLEVCTCL